MTHQAKGTFTVKLHPAPADEGRIPVNRLFLDKEYTGDLVATAQGDMLSAGNPADGSAAYVAIEHVSGTMNGKQGGFSLAHSGMMDKGEQHLTITIVPGSGTGELEGIAGKLTLTIVERQHHYEIDYTL
ncbi:DUF3224 domain-containing protein [Massilia cavernae]|uniref:DUF3224 domain-containing protein n=1 Tax=Massilia cavernae TaxID=2320864 RepID=A0A418XQG1_9BURK|nr:DUF3224 domain-containing protein [Massilia cavernae]RJG14742.1 DUF3224 domain-containing protein [Massilia cavernae]